MRVLYLTNNRIGLRCLEVLRTQGDVLAGLVLHPPAKARFRDEILEASGLGADLVFPGERIREPDLEAHLGALGADAVLSVHFGYLVGPGLLGAAPRGAYNLHPGYLPWNRGLYPNVWAIVDRTPAGATLHVMDEGIDTGPIVARRQVQVHPEDTGETLYGRIEEAELEVFREVWPKVRDGSARAFAPMERGTSHTRRDLSALDRLDPDAAMTVRELVDRLRARTFPPHSGCYLEEGGRRISLRLQLGKDP